MNITPSKFWLSVSIAICAFILWITIRKIHKKYVQKYNPIGEIGTMIRVAFGIVKSVVVLGAILLVLEVNGVNVSAVFAGLGLMSAVLGLALQDALKDSIMGMHIIRDHFFSVGDVVKYGDFEGTVVRFTMQTTTLESSIDNSILTVCNRNISEIVKIPSEAMVDINLPLPYEEDSEHIHHFLTEVCEGISGVDGVERCEYKGTTDFGASAVFYKIRFYCSSHDKYEIRRRVLRFLQRKLELGGLHIPYDQIDIHTK